jgi:hypothetical protein
MSRFPETYSDAPEFKASRPMMRDSVIGDRTFVLVPYEPLEALSVKEAAELAGNSPSTIRSWCERYEVARKIAGGNWQVSWIALQMLLENNWEALAAYNTGDRTSPRVAEYLKRFEQYAQRRSAHAKIDGGRK